MPRYIDADALMTVPNVRKVSEYDETGEYITYHAVPVEAIKNAPTIEAEPVRYGRRIDGSHKFGAKNGEYRVCSTCNICIPDIAEVPERYWQKCPNCGTKMNSGARMGRLIDENAGLGAAENVKGERM